MLPRPSDLRAILMRAAVRKPVVTQESRKKVEAVLTQIGEAPSAAEELLPLVYDELKRLAAAYMRSERQDHTLQPTALVHEAYLKLVDQTRIDWKGRTHFLAVGARAMRRLLVDHARARSRDKRGGQWKQVTLNEVVTPSGGREMSPEQLLSLHTAIGRLGQIDPRQAQIVELKYFGGLKVAEVAEVLGVSKRTVEDHWVHARAWLRRELAQD